MIVPFHIHHLLSVLSFLLGFALLPKLLRERRPPGSTFAWLLGMTLVPYLGVPLYFAFGGRKFKRRARSKREIFAGPRVRLEADFPHTPAPETARVLTGSGAPPPTQAIELELLETGGRAYTAIFALLESARVSIRVETFILGGKGDPVASAFLEVLTRKAKAGVEVRLLLDGLGSFWASRAGLTQLRRAGGETATFMPIFHLPFVAEGRTNFRDHRKLILVDGETAIFGGMNLASEYLGTGAEGERWIDCSMRATGPVLADLDQVFRSDWEFASGKDLTSGVRPEAPGNRARNGAGASVQVAPSGPDMPDDPLYDSLFSAFFGARERIWIVSPYFIPDDALTKALELASRRGVEVRILVPGRSNHRFADLGRGQSLRTLEEAGARILLYPRMLHAKLVIVDRTQALVGSANLDLRSLLLNFELGVFVYSEAEVGRLAAWVETKMDESTTGLPPASALSSLGEGIAHALGPLL